MIDEPDTRPPAPAPAGAAKPRSAQPGPRGDPRAARLKAALRANLTRRKAQGRARMADDDAPGSEAADD